MEALAEIYESLLATDEVVEDWKVANVVPIFKKDCKEKPGNHRGRQVTGVWV